MSIEALLQAAEYLERRDREAEHGYASTLPYREDYHRRRPAKAKKPQGNRSSHNELEKNRRAHLRNCLEQLKDVVPLGPETNKHTTQGLLTRARSFIKNLEEKDRRHSVAKDKLHREQRYLQRRLDQLRSQIDVMYKRRSTSDSSSTASNSSTLSETDEVDIMGYNSNQSDADDQSSVQSASSDGGITISSQRLSLTS